MTDGAQAWSYAVARLAAVLAAGVVLGLLLGAVWAGLAVALALTLAWNLVQLYRLDYWLRGRSSRQPPDAEGLWGSVISNVVRLHRRKRFHKQRLVDVFRELRRSTAAMPDGVLVLTVAGEILWFNPTAARLLGLRRRVDQGIRVTHLLRHPEFGRYMESGDFHEALVIAHPSREGVWLSLQVVPYSSNQRLMLVRDVSRQMALESMRKDFVANASHELRSPLTVITGYLETLVHDDQLDPALEGPLGEMRRQAARMNTIVADLLELSRLDARTREASDAPVDVAALLAMLRKDVLAMPVHPEISVQVESPAGLLGDEAGIHSAFSNLVQNAAKYTPAGGSILVRWWVDDDGGHFSVSDTGIGIPAEHIPRLTERFYRVDAGRARTTGGSGLGLAIVKHVLEHHGATLAIQSEEGKGSTFACHFPPRRVMRGPQDANIGAI
jgi:two-component system, OmpR family, phosphate regulon sensor histidine kinase PhoR